MTYEEFKEELLKGLQDFYGKDMDVDICRMNRNNRQSYDGVRIIPKEVEHRVTIAPVICFGFPDMISVLYSLHCNAGPFQFRFQRIHLLSGERRVLWLLLLAGLPSDSFKRACFNWGIGRELYTAPFIWIPADRTEIQRGFHHSVIKCLAHCFGFPDMISVLYSLHCNAGPFQFL